jgi:hypothetical protein
MIRYFLILLIVIGLASCDNFEIDHPDFDYTAGFFPYQFPVRTLVLGDYIYDNTNDNNHKFVISVAMGGVYNNEKDRIFEIEVDESLCNEILFNTDGDTIRALPPEYYTLSSETQIVIPKGKFNGGIEVQLTDAFFDDSVAYTSGFVVPLRLKGSQDVDKILVGTPSVDNADPRVPAQWIEPPKNFTMFAVKYINEYHGTYFHYGQSSVKDGSNTVVEDTVYQATYIESNPTSKMLTIGRNQVSLNMFLRSEVMPAEADMVLDFDGVNCTVTAAEDSPYAISGTGVFKAKEYTWGNKSRDGIELNFTVSDGTNTYEASDVLVIRDRAVVMEVYSPVLY